jgi:hypothetical protein
MRCNPAIIAKYLWSKRSAQDTLAQEGSILIESLLVSFRRDLRVTVPCEIRKLLRCARRGYEKGAASDANVLSQYAISRR